MYIYPDNLRAKATLWLWELRDVAIIGVGGIAAVASLTELHFLPPAVLVAAYAFLSIRFEDASILDFLQSARAFFITRQQYFEWRLEPECAIKSSVRTGKRKVPGNS